ncbi:MAG: hypothetical protein JWR21_1809 [Herminiimonas sp.]|nr:hypothetical protein [Herminiimonas sp.]
MDDLQRKLTCSGCGANLEYTAGTQALKCQYCSVITEIHREEDQLEDLPDVVIPLAVEKHVLEQAVYEHLASGHYTPDDLVEQAVLSKVERMYVPAFWFTGRFEAQWTASFGYDRTEHYTAYETRTENGRSHQVPVSKTKTVTEWRPVNGVDSGRFSVLAYSGSRLQARVLPLVEHSRGMGNVTRYDVSFLSGVETEPFSVTEANAYSTRADPQIDLIIDQSVQSHAQGDRQKDWHWTASTNKDGQSALVPVCHVIYEYDGKSYEVWTDGTDPQIQVTDELPKDHKRKRNVQIGFFPAVAVSLAVLLAGLRSDGGGLFSAFTSGTVAIVAAAWAYAFWRRHALLGYSKKLRQSLLAQKTAAKSNLSKLSEAAGNTLANSFRAPKKPWLLVARMDKAVLAVSTAAFCGAVFFASFGDKASLSPDRPNLTGSSIVAKTSVALPAPPVEIQQVSQESTPADLASLGTSTASAQPAEVSPPVAATQSSTPDTSGSATTMPAGASTDSTGTQVAVVGTDSSAPHKSEPLLLIIQAAVKQDWATVDQDVQRLKPSSPVPRGDRKISRSANGEGLLALQQKDFASAINAFTRAVRADVSDIEVRNNLGFAYLQAKDLDNAVNTLGEVLKQAPDRSSAWANLADALAQADKQSAAEASLRLAVRYSANRKKTVEYLGKTVESHEGADKFREVAARVLKDIDSIPQAGMGPTAVQVGAQVVR